MFETIQLLTLGAAAVIDTVLLLALADRRNRQVLQWRLLVAIAGVWLWHLGLLAHYLVVGDADTSWAGGVRLACVLVPAAAVLVLAYFVVRHNFLQLVVDRSSVYAGLVVGLVLGHQLLFQDISAELPENWRAPLVFLEGAILAGLIMACPPWRHRSAEALRYLLGSWVAEQRDRLQGLATRMSAEASRPPAELVGWFADALRDALEVDFIAGWLFRPDRPSPLHWGESARLDDAAATRLCKQVEAAGTYYTRRAGPNPEAAKCLQFAGASLAVVKAYHGATGLMLIGKHSRNRELVDEEIHAVLLLVEQLTVTLDNGALQAERLDAERRAAHTEKLSALGLLASSIAHEVKNPLSAIKTIAAVLAEDLGADSPHAEDVRLILGEIDRLAATTTQLLEFARPRRDNGRPGCVASVLAGSLQILRHLARQRDVTVEWRLADALPLVRADEQALREIFFNLLSNALEAAAPGGRVVVTCTASADGVVAEVRDSGPGIPAEVRARLFEPFLTTKAEGTGLGLYAVGRRVRELGGEIVCHSEPGHGTAFTVRLTSV
jgi:signal transduction histidine kinase